MFHFNAHLDDEFEHEQYSELSFLFNFHSAGRMNI